jgi:uncharacterized protein
MIVVSDTSPISALLKIGEVQLLKQLFGEVIIPVAVQNELLRAHSNLPLWVRVVSVQNLISAAKFRALVDAGEAEAIQLAKELRADRILIDDHKGRTLAEREGLRAIGLVGVIALAKKKGMITSARKVVSDLQVRAHVYVAQAIIDAVLKELGE